MKITSARTLTSKRLGFSLVELLVTIAIIGMLSALVIPSMAATSASETIRNRRNAQELSSMSRVAQAAGLDFVQDHTLVESVANVIHGGSPTTGIFKGRWFSVQGITARDASGALRFLRLEDGQLVYSITEVENPPTFTGL